MSQPTPATPPKAQAPTPDELRAFLVKHRLTQRQFAELIPQSLRNVERWLAGTRAPDASLWRILRDIEREQGEPKITVLVKSKNKHIVRERATNSHSTDNAKNPNFA